MKVLHLVTKVLIKNFGAPNVTQHPTMSPLTLNKELLIRGARVT